MADVSRDPRENWLKWLFWKNEVAKSGYTKKGLQSVRESNPPQKLQNRGRVALVASDGSGFISRRGAESAEIEARRRTPPFPRRLRETHRSGMELGTPFSVAFQATRWKRRIRIAPTATRGTDARPRTSIATKSIFAHISCVGLRQPPESRESTPVSNTCHSA